jgi:hypothetical protein
MLQMTATGSELSRKFRPKMGLSTAEAKDENDLGRTRINQPMEGV